MKARVFSHEKLIGTTYLQVGDESMGHVYGEFLPTENYYNNVQPAVWKFVASNKPNLVEWNSLKFNVQLNNGCFLFAVGGITFSDLKEMPEEPIQIDIAGIDSYIIHNFIQKGSSGTFVVEPWEPISIRQKLIFEEELQKELGLEIKEKLFFNFLKKSKSHNHVLSGFEVLALCHHQGNDDVLFRINKQGFDKEFALVHLTWRGDKESEGYPLTHFYKDYDEFKYLKMYPDKNEREY